MLGVANSNASIGNYHGLKKIHMPLSFQQDKGNEHNGFNLFIMKLNTLTFCEKPLHSSNHWICISENPILTVLESRTQDKIAQEFVKRQRQRFIPSFLQWFV